MGTESAGPQAAPFVGRRACAVSSCCKPPRLFCHRFVTFRIFPCRIFLSETVFFRRKWVLTSYFTAKTLTKVGVVCILNTVFRLVTKVTIQSALPQGSARAGNLFQEVRL